MGRRAVVVGLTIGRYVVGVVALIAVCGSVGLAAVSIRRRYIADWVGPPARLTEAVIGLAVLTAVLEVLGAVGLFRLIPIVLACLIIGAIGRGPVAWPRASPLSATGAVAVLAGAVVLAEWAAPTLEAYDFGIRTFDSLWYHLPWAASFAQTGHITALRFTDVEYLTAFYPATAELFHGLGIVLFARDVLSPALNVMWLGLVLLAGYCLGRPWRIGPVTMTGAALAMATPMARFSQAGSAANDVVAVFFLLAAAALLVNGRDRRAVFVLAAVSGGLAVAVKLTVLVPVAAMTVGLFVARLIRGHRSRVPLWLVPLLLAGGFWYLRNLIAVGNPLPWVSLPGLTKPIAPLQQHTAFTVAHYLFNGHVWHTFLEPGLAAGLGPWWLVILVISVAGSLLCVLPGADSLVRVLGLVALVSWIGYVVTPETAAGPAGAPLGFAFNLRYAMPALALSLTVAPLAPVLRRAPGQAWILAALLIVLVATLAQSRLWPSGYLAGTVLAGAGAVVVAAAIWRRPLPTLLLALVLAIVGGHFVERHYLRVRYAYQPGISSLARVWSFFRRVHHARVGVVGTFGGFFSYPLYGIDSSNRVEYVAHRGPHGSFTPITSCPSWRAALSAGRFRYVVTTPARDPWHPNTLSFSPEGDWTAHDPNARTVYSYRAFGQPISVFELTGRLDPAGCR